MTATTTKTEGHQPSESHTQLEQEQEHEHQHDPSQGSDDPATIRARAMSIVNGCLTEAAAGTTPLQTVKITNTTTVDDVVYYEITVSVGSVRWSLTRRYAEFHSLNALLEQRVRHTHSLPPFPARSPKYLVNHLSAHFITVRRSLLHNYLAKILTSSKLRGCPPFLAFLTPSQDHHVNNIDYKHTGDTSSLAPVSSSSQSSSYATSILAHASFRNMSSSPTAELLELDDDDSPTGDGDGDGTDPTIWASDEVTAVSIPAAQILKHDHVVYQINVENIHKRKSFARWTVLKRYQEFFDLDAELRATYALQPEILALLPDLPARRLKLMVDHLEPRFIEERRIHLQVYLEELIKVPAFCSHTSLLLFLGCM